MTSTNNPDSSSSKCTAARTGTQCHSRHQDHETTTFSGSNHHCHPNKQHGQDALASQAPAQLPQQHQVEQQMTAHQPASVLDSEPTCQLQVAAQAHPLPRAEDASTSGVSRLRMENNQQFTRQLEDKLDHNNLKPVQEQAQVFPSVPLPPHDDVQDQELQATPLPKALFGSTSPKIASMNPTPTTTPPTATATTPTPTPACRRGALKYVSKDKHTHPSGLPCPCLPNSRSSRCKTHPCTSTCDRRVWAPKLPRRSISLLARLHDDDDQLTYSSDCQVPQKQRVCGSEQDLLSLEDLMSCSWHQLNAILSVRSCLHHKMHDNCKRHSTTTSELKRNAEDSLRKQDSESNSKDGSTGGSWSGFDSDSESECSSNTPDLDFILDFDVSPKSQLESKEQTHHNDDQSPTWTEFQDKTDNNNNNNNSNEYDNSNNIDNCGNESNLIKNVNAHELTATLNLCRLPVGSEIANPFLPISDFLLSQPSRASGDQNQQQQQQQQQHQQQQQQQQACSLSHIFNFATLHQNTQLMPRDVESTHSDDDDDTTRQTTKHQHRTQTTPSYDHFHPHHQTPQRHQEHQHQQQQEQRAK